MSREILFRAWANGQFWYSDDEAYILKQYEDGLYLCENESFYNGRIGTCEYVKIGKAEQYTGLKDKNGVKIFEGDIIKYDDNEDMSMWVSGEVAHIINLGFKTVARMKPFDKSDGTNQNILSADFSDCVEIIGNIHDEVE